MEDIMKKIFAYLTTAALVCCLSGCGNKGSDDEKTPDRVSTAPIDEQIIGTWMNEYVGYRFQADRNVSLIKNCSDYAHFDGSSLVYDYFNITIDSENIEDNGTDVRVFYPYTDPDTGEASEMDILLMSRTEPSNSGFDGTYHITGGAIGDDLASILGATPNEFDMIADISGKDFTVTFNNFSQYETVDGNLDMFGDNILVPGDGDDYVRYAYTIEGDTLTMTFDSNQTSEPEIYTKVK